MAPTFVVVGAGMAGAVASATLRQEGFDGNVLLIGAEPHPPYERPPLSKSYLRGEIPFDKTLVRPETFYEQNAIDLLLGVRATCVEPDERYVELDTRERVHYDKLLIATGAHNRRPAIPGIDLPGALALRSVDDADVLRREMTRGRRAVVIGMGFIGCEVAASLRQAGIEVVAVHPSPAPLFHVLGLEVAQVIAEIHRENGVEMNFGESVTSLVGDTRVEEVVTSRGRRIGCDFAVVGIGVEPEVEFLSGSGVETDNGVLVDEYCRTNIENIYAAGDVAHHYHPLARRRLRVEHWQNAMLQGAAAARNMLGRERPYDPVHWFWSDQYDANLQYAGFHNRWNRMVVRGRLDRRDFMAFYLNEGRVEGVVALNRSKEIRRAMALITSRKAVDIEALQNEERDLRSLAR